MRRLSSQSSARTRTGDFQGRRLRLLVNDKDQQIHLRIAEVDFIRLASSGAPPNDETAVVEFEAPYDDEGPAVVADAATDVEDQPITNEPAPTPVDDAPADPVEDEPFYILTLHDSVRIVQGNAIDSPSISGDSMSIIFTLKSKGFSQSLGAGRSSRSTSEPQSTGLGAPMRAEQLIAIAAISAPADDEPSIAPPPRDDDTYIWCTGPLTVEPLKERKRMLESPLDARVELTGDPVRFNDPRTDSDARCGLLRYDSRHGRMELHSTEEHPLDISSPRFKAAAPLFWYDPNADRGGFEGEGWMELRRRAARRRSRRSAPRRGRSGPRPLVETRQPRVHRLRRGGDRRRARRGRVHRRRSSLKAGG